MAAASARQVKNFGGDGGSGVQVFGGIGGGGGGGDYGGFDVNLARETLEIQFENLPRNERIEILKALLVQVLEKLSWNGRRKISKAGFVEAMQPWNERSEILKDLFVEAMEKLPWEGTEILEAPMEKAVDELECRMLEIERSRREANIKKEEDLSEEERANFIKRREERAAARKALERVEREADVEDNFKVTRELQEYIAEASV